MGNVKSVASLYYTHLVTKEMLSSQKAKQTLLIIDFYLVQYNIPVYLQKIRGKCPKKN